MLTRLRSALFVLCLAACLLLPWLGVAQSTGVVGPESATFDAVGQADLAAVGTVTFDIWTIIFATLAALLPALAAHFSAFVSSNKPWMKAVDMVAGNYLKARNQAQVQDWKLKVVNTLVPILLACLLIGGQARAVDAECAHMLTEPDCGECIFEVSDGNLALCTPALSRLGNPMPADLVIESCSVDFGAGSSYTATGPFGGAELVATPIPLVLEFDHPVSVSCRAGGSDGPLLAATGRFPFSGPGAPGAPR